MANTSLTLKLLKTTFVQKSQFNNLIESKNNLHNSW